jgi:hypothetical protein
VVAAEETGSLFGLAALYRPEIQIVKRKRRNLQKVGRMSAEKCRIRNFAGDRVH